MHMDVALEAKMQSGESRYREAEFTIDDFGGSWPPMLEGVRTNEGKEKTSCRPRGVSGHTEAEPGARCPWRSRQGV